MPNVPGRSCNACKARKKKCDQVQPSCSRCVRLGIQCVGSGVQRFKFHVATTSSPRHTHVGVPSRPLQNEVTSTVGELIQTLEIDDPRFCIVSLGGFFEDIPRRLGRSDCLDAAAKAFAAVMSIVRTGQVTVPMLTDYGAALRSLRRTFVAKPDQVMTIETLCAIYMVMICQNWMGGSRTEFSMHVQGLMHILNSEAARHWQDSFSRQVMGITSLLAISESVTNPHIEFTPQFVPKVKPSGPSPGPRQANISDPETIKLENLLNYPKYLTEPELYLDEIRERYEQAKLESQMLVGLIAGMIGAQQQQQQQQQQQEQEQQQHHKHEEQEEHSQRSGSSTSKSAQASASASTSTSTSESASSSSSSSPSPPPSPAAFIRMYILCEAGAGVLISVATLLNQILQIFNPSDGLLQVDTEYFASEVINVAERVKHLRPLGCTFVPPTLCMALVTTQNAATRAKLGELISYYHADFRGAKPSDFTSWLEMRFAMMRERAGKTETTAAGEVQDDSGIESGEESSSPWEELSTTGTRPCCIM